MSYKIDLERRIRESYGFIDEYEEILHHSSDPKEQARARRAIEEQWGFIKGYLDEYIPLCNRLKVNISEELAKIVAYFPEYEALFPQVEPDIASHSGGGTFTTSPATTPEESRPQTTSQEKRMTRNWLPSDLMPPLRQALLDCGPFNEDRQLRAVFGHPLLSPWRNQVPQAYSVQDRVDYTLDFLLERNSSDGTNLLIVFLNVLIDRINPADACHHRLAELAQQLAAAFQGDASSSQPAEQPDSRGAAKRVSSASLVPPGPVRQRWALLVGINHYIDPTIAPLKYCVNDVKALEQILKEQHYKVISLHDEVAEEWLQPTKDNFEETLVRLLARIEPDDLLWLHFAGHGQLVDGQPMLMTRQTRIRTLTRSGLSLPAIAQQMRDSQARRLIITLDACHVGVDIGRSGSDPAFNYRVHDLAEGFALFAASSSQQKAQEWEAKAHGVFTYYLLEALSGQADREGKGFVTVDDVKNYALNGLRDWSVLNGGLLQEPTAQIEGLGDMILVDYRTG